MSKTEEMRELINLFEDISSKKEETQQLDELFGIGGKKEEGPKTVADFETSFKNNPTQWANWVVKASKSKDHPKWLNKNYFDMASMFLEKKMDLDALKAKFEQEINWTKTTGKQKYGFESITTSGKVLTETDVKEIESLVNELEELARTSKDPKVKEHAAKAASVLKARILDR